jgi:hypothetical protein
MDCFVAALLAMTDKKQPFSGSRPERDGCRLENQVESDPGFVDSEFPPLDFSGFRGFLLKR